MLAGLEHSDAEREGGELPRRQALNRHTKLRASVVKRGNDLGLAVFMQQHANRGVRDEVNRACKSRSKARVIRVCRACESHS